jgi:DNA-binding FrmR family transcriptional regulator
MLDEMAETISNRIREISIQIEVLQEGESTWDIQRQISALQNEADKLMDDLDRLYDAG